MYKSIAHLVDNLIELYYMLYWLSSIRITFGEYAHFVSNLEDNGKAIFLSDFIYFYCCEEGNIHYYCRFNKNYLNYIIYISRIKAVSKNYTDDIYEYNKEITIIVNEYININSIEYESPGLGMYY